MEDVPSLIFSVLQANMAIQFQKNECLLSPQKKKCSKLHNLWGGGHLTGTCAKGN